MIKNRLKSTGDLIFAEIDVYDHREAKSDGACTGRHYYAVNVTECVDECRNPVFCISKKSGKIAGRQSAEDKGGTNCDCYDMDN